jgi:hypothetical protein
MYAARVLQLLLGLVAIGVAGSDIFGRHDTDCASPGPLNYNIAIVI